VKTAIIKEIEILNIEDNVFSIVTDWTDDKLWPEDQTVKARLEALLGKSVDSITFMGSEDLNEGIYQWTNQS